MPKAPKTKFIDVHIRLAEDEYECLRRESFETRRSQSEIVREALRKRWENLKK